MLTIIEFKSLAMAPSELRLNEVINGFLDPVKPKAGIIFMMSSGLSYNATSSLHDGFYFLPKSDLPSPFFALACSLALFFLFHSVLATNRFYGVLSFLLDLL